MKDRPRNTCRCSVGCPVGAALATTLIWYAAAAGGLAQAVRPTITAHPQSQTAAIGSDVTFSVTASGTLPMVYFWGGPANGSAPRTVITTNSNTCLFTLRDVQMNHAGSWNVVVTNAAGASSISSNAQLALFIPILGVGFDLVQETCLPVNGTIDPYERVTMDVALLNTNAPGTGRLVATLLEEGGVTSPSGPQSYEGLSLGGPPVTQPFTFSATGPCGGTNVATFRLFDGTNDLGRVRFPFRLGVVGSNDFSCCQPSIPVDLGLGLAQSPTVGLVGTNLTYTLWVSNAGPGVATGVTVATEPLLSCMTFVSAIPSQGACSPSAGAVACGLGALLNHGTASVALTFQPTRAGGTLTNTFHVSSSQTDPSLANNVVAAETKILAALNVSDAVAAEGSPGTLAAVFNVGLSAPSDWPVTVDFTTVDGTAVAGNDYLATNGTLFFPPGVTNQAVTVSVLDDPVFEFTEIFHLSLGHPTDTRLERSQGSGMIMSDDPYTEGVVVVWQNPGPIAYGYGYSFSHPDGWTPLFPFRPYPSSIEVSGINAGVGKVEVTLHNFSSLAASGLDVLLVGPGGQSVLLMSDAGGDAEDVTLTFDDAAPAALPQSQELVSGTYHPTDYGTGISPVDYFPAPGPLPPYGTQLSAFIGTNPNGLWRLFVLMTNRYDSPLIHGGWSLKLSHGVSASIGDAASVEGNHGTNQLALQVTLPGPSSETVTINYETADGTAVAGHDYVAASGELTFPPGTTNQTLAIVILGDTTPEGTELFFVNLIAPAHVNFTRSQGVARIIDDELAAANDHFLNATVLTGEFANATALTSLASLEAGEPGHAGRTGGKSLWWSWTAPDTGKVILSTVGSSFDTVLAVYVGDAVDALQPAAANDNARGDPTSEVALNVVSNITYRIAVDGVEGASGEVKVNLRFKPGVFVISDRPRSDFWTTTGPISAIVETNDTVYVAGAFGAVLPRKGSGLVVNRQTGDVALDFPTVDGIVFAAAPDGANGLYLGGDFVAVGGVRRTNLVHIRADHTVDLDWTPASPDVISEIAVGHGQVFVVTGEHQVVGLDSQTGAWTGWIWPAQPDEAVGIYALATTGDTLLVGGYTNGTSHLLLGLDMNTAAVTMGFDFKVDTSGSAFPGYITSLAASCDAVYAAGPRFPDGPETSSLLARFDLTSREASWYVYAFTVLSGSYGSRLGDRTLALALAGKNLYVGGTFNRIGGQTRAGLAALDAKTGQITPWDAHPVVPPVTGSAMADISTLPAAYVLASAGNTLFAWGNFTNVAGQPRAYLAGFDVETGQATPLSIGARDLSATTMAVSGQNLYLGGSVAGARTLARDKIAAFDAATGLPTRWDPRVVETNSSRYPPARSIDVLAASAERIYVGGDFLGFFGGSIPTFVADLFSFEATAGRLTGTWRFTVGDSHRIYNLLLSGDDLFTAGGGLSQGPYVRALDPTTNRPPRWHVGLSYPPYDFNGSVTELARLGNTLYVGGKFTGIFTGINAVPRAGLAALDTATGAVKTWDPDADFTAELNSGVIFPNPPSALAASGNTVFVAGPFSFIGGGQYRYRLAALDGVTGDVLEWDARMLDGTISHLTVADDTLYVTGDTLSFAGQIRHGLAALDASSASLNEWNPQTLPRAVATTVFATGRRVYAGMQQTNEVRRRTHVRFSLAAFQPEGAPVFSEQPRSQVVLPGQVIELQAQAAGQSWLSQSYQWQFNGTNIAGATNTTLSIANAQPLDSGEYAVLVRNALGQIRSDEALVTVAVPPQITSQPVRGVAGPFTTIVLSVTATGTGPLRYQWRLNGVNIPGAYGPTYPIPLAQPTNGGVYSVVVANLGGAVQSDGAEVLITSPGFPFDNDLSARGSISGFSGLGSGHNVGATKEADEPNHFGKPGGASVWLSWTAPASGIATFSTRGSAFDTLLGIYAGASLADLTFVAADEDRGGFLTSRASFNAVAGIEYLIAVDGFAGATGNIVLSWNLDTSTVPFPRIITQPLGQAAFTGQTVRFEVDVSSMTPVAYQWFKGCSSIPGGTNATLEITNVQRSDVGEYRVLVMNDSTRVAESSEAALEIGPDPKVISRDKPEDLFPEFLSGGAGAFALASLPGGFITVSLGSIQSQTLDNTGATTQPGEPIHCGVSGGASKWLRLRPEIDATFLIDTLGSRIDTVLAVYQPTNLLNLAAGLVACDNNSASDGIRSVVLFNARGNTDYLVVVDGVSGAEGLVSLNWKLGRMPVLTSPTASSPAARSGQSITLRVTATNLFGATYQWRWGGQNIIGATNDTLLLPDVTPASAGAYTVTVKNAWGTATSTFTLLVELPFLRAGPMQPPGVYRIWLPGADAPRFILESSPRLTGNDWTPLYTIGPSNTLPYLDFPQTDSVHQFYRARPVP